MRRTTFATLGAALLLVAFAGADDKGAIALDLKAAKFKPEAGSGTDLFGHNEDEGKLFYYTNGAAEWAVKVPADGTFQVVVKASGDTAMNVRPKFKVTVDGKEVGKETQLTQDEAKEYTLTAPLKAGERKLAVVFTNDTYKEGEYDSNLYVHAVTLKAAAAEPAKPASGPVAK